MVKAQLNTDRYVIKCTYVQEHMRQNKTEQDCDKTKPTRHNEEQKCTVCT